MTIFGIEPFQHTYAKQHNVGGPGPFTKVAVTFSQAGNATANLIAPLSGPSVINTATTAQLVAQARFDALCLVMSRYGRPVAIAVSPDSFGNLGNVVVFTYEGTQEGIFGSVVNPAPNQMSIPATPITAILTTAIASGATTSLVVNSTAAPFPQTTPFDIVVNSEVMTVTAIVNGTTFTVTRGARGTTALAAIGVGTLVALATSGTITDGQALNMTAPVGVPPFYYVTKSLPGLGDSDAVSGSLLNQLRTINHDPAALAASALFTGATPFLYNSDTAGVSAGGVTFSASGGQIVATFTP